MGHSAHGEKVIGSTVAANDVGGLLYRLQGDGRSGKFAARNDDCIKLMVVRIHVASVFSN
jgi:hypothetical protein